MSSSGAELRTRISSVQSAHKIVSALRLVSAARIRASSNAALRARPFAEHLQNVLAHLVRFISERRIDIPAHASRYSSPTSLQALHGPVLADPLVQKALLDRIYLTVLNPQQPSSSSTQQPPNTLVTVVAADRKFCGSYNKDVLSRAALRVRHLERAGVKVSLLLLGRIARLFFETNFPHLPVLAYFPLPASSTSPEHTATSLSHTLLSEFIAGSVQRVEIVYTHFVSLISTAPSTRTLLPLTPTGLESVGDELFHLTLTSTNGRLVATRQTAPPSSPYLDPILASQLRSSPLQHKLYDISDQEAVTLLNTMLPMYITSQLVRIVREAIASEQVSRLAAMTAATDNAEELVSSLQTQYNKERQARITTEIIEVMSSVS